MASTKIGTIFIKTTERFLIGFLSKGLKISLSGVKNDI